MSSSVNTFCDLPFNKIKVAASGEVTMCCFQSGTLGNLMKSSFSDIWESNAAKLIRRATEAGELHEMCTGWGGCPFLCKPRVNQPVTFEPAYPTQIELDLPNTHCNIGGTSPTPETACFMCPRSIPDFIADVDITLEIAKKLSFLMPTLTDLRIQGLSELFWKDRVFEVLETLGFEQYKHQCHFSAYSNAIVFNTPQQTRFIDACPDSRLFFSIDAVTHETYIKVRRLPAFDRVIANIKEFAKNKKDGQHFEIANNINMVNLHEAVPMVDLAADLGAEGVQFNPTHDGGTGRVDLHNVQVNESNYQEFARVQDLIIERGHQRQIPVILTRPLALHYPDMAKVGAIENNPQSRWKKLLNLIAK